VVEDGENRKILKGGIPFKGPNPRISINTVNRIHGKHPARIISCVCPCGTKMKGHFMRKRHYKAKCSGCGVIYDDIYL